jgi:hypothetical protein
MPDSDAIRSRRKRAHASGDHHLCKHWPQAAPVSQLPAGDPGELDPAAELAALAGRLSAAYAADTGNAALARELRMTLLAMQSRGGADPELAEFFRGFADG